MKLTESVLRQMVKEELEAVLAEAEAEEEEHAAELKGRIAAHRKKHPRESDDPEKNPHKMGPSAYRIAKAAGVEKTGIKKKS